MADFALNEDQLQIQKWVHDFAEDVIRPAGHEWDEREEFPYPIVEQAAEIGLYGWEFLTEQLRRSDRAHAAGRDRGDVLGRRRHRHGDHGLGAWPPQGSAATARPSR